MASHSPVPAWLLGRVYRCAWCMTNPIEGGLPHYRYELGEHGLVAKAVVDGDFSGSDGICPAHRRHLLRMADEVADQKPELCSTC